MMDLSNLNLDHLMAQAKSFSEKQQRELEEMAVKARSGGGAVTVTVNGKKELTKIDITEDAMRDREMLEDLILAALGAAYGEVDKRLQAKMPGLEGMDLSAIRDMFK